MSLETTRIKAIVATMVGQCLYELEKNHVPLVYQLAILIYLRSRKNLLGIHMKDVDSDLLRKKLESLLVDTEICDYLNPLKRQNLIAFPGASRDQIPEILAIFDAEFLKSIQSLKNAIAKTGEENLLQLTDEANHPVSLSVVYSHTEFWVKCPPRFEYGVLRWFPQNEPVAAKAAKSILLFSMMATSAVLGVYMTTMLTNRFFSMVAHWGNDEPEDNTIKLLCIAFATICIPIGLCCSVFGTLLLMPAYVDLINTFRCPRIYRSLEEEDEMRQPLLGLRSVRVAP